MIEVTDEQFAMFMEEAMDALPREHMNAVKNVAIVYADEPTERQREDNHLQPQETLFGLYEGVPLAERQGVTSYGPDKITIFKLPIARSVSTLAELKEEIKHTLWHEIAHYFGLNHTQIHELE